MDWEQWRAELEEWGSLSAEIGGIPIRQWLLAAAVFVVAAFVLRIVKAIVSRRVHRFADRTTTKWDDALVKAVDATKLWFLLMLAAYAASLILHLPDDTQDGVESVTIVVLLIQAALWGNQLLTFSLQRYVEQRMETDAAAVTTVSALGFIGKLVLWAVVVLLALDNLGIDVTALVAGLGIGGIAVALAAQNVLGDLFASLSIVLDKPFVLGDFIIVGDCMGTVEKIGLKTSRLRSLSGEQLIFSNADLLQSRVRNYKRMYERRIVFEIGVTYQTPKEKLEAIPGMIRELVEAQEQARFDRSHFKALADFAMTFETVYYVLVPDYAVYMDVQQAINLGLVERFEREGIEFAYPTQTVFLEGTEPQPAAQ